MVAIRGRGGAIESGRFRCPATNPLARAPTPSLPSPPNQGLGPYSRKAQAAFPAALPAATNKFSGRPWPGSINAYGESQLGSAPVRRWRQMRFKRVSIIQSLLSAGKVAAVSALPGDWKRGHIPGQQGNPVRLFLPCQPPLSPRTLNEVAWVFFPMIQPTTASSKGPAAPVHLKPGSPWPFLKRLTALMQGWQALEGQHSKAVTRGGGEPTSPPARVRCAQFPTPDGEGLSREGGGHQCARVPFGCVRRGRARRRNDRDRWVALVLAFKPHQRPPMPQAGLIEAPVHPRPLTSFEGIGECAEVQYFPSGCALARTKPAEDRAGA